MLAIKEVEITDAELGLAHRKGNISLDKYIEVRLKLGLKPAPARLVASLRRLHLEDYAEAKAIGMRHKQIIGLAQGPFNLSVIVDLMKSGATLDEAYEACEAFVPITGSCSYQRLRSKDHFDMSHREIIRLTNIAHETPGTVIASQFLELVVRYRINEMTALEIARTGLKPHFYLEATNTLEIPHQTVMDNCKTFQSVLEFERMIYRARQSRTLASMEAARNSAL